MVSCGSGNTRSGSYTLSMSRKKPAIFQIFLTLVLKYIPNGNYLTGMLLHKNASAYCVRIRNG
jgi:hypothetical protein